MPSFQGKANFDLKGIEITLNSTSTKSMIPQLIHLWLHKKKSQFHRASPQQLTLVLEDQNYYHNIAFAEE